VPDEVALSPEIARAVIFQSYGPEPGLEGVFFKPLPKHRALEGWFAECLRLTDGQVEDLPVSFAARQISLAAAVPGRINAFHIHPRAVQDELWCVVQGTLLVWLVDCRAGSPTLGRRSRHLLSAEAPGLLYVPSGVAHGYRAGPQGALLLYAANSQFDPETPNEGRLPWDYFGSELWGDDRG